MATLHIRIDDETKAEADSLFTNLGLDTSKAVRMFITAAIEKKGIPFTVKKPQSKKPNADTLEATLYYIDNT